MLRRSSLLLIGFAALAPAYAASFSLAIRTDRDVVARGDDIVVVATITNSSDRMIFPDFGSSPVDYLVEMYDGAGNAVPDSAFARRLKSPDTVFVGGLGPAMEPGATRAVQVNVSKLFDVPGPGTYSIQLRKYVGSEYGGGELRSNVVLVTVLPRAAGSAPRAPGPVPTVAPDFAASSGPASQHVKLVISADRTDVFVGGEIPVYVKLTNPPPVDPSLPSNIGFYANAEVRKAVGKPAPVLASGLVQREWKDSSAGAARPPARPAGGTYGGPRDVTKYFDMSEPGTYFVQFWIKVPEQFGGGELRSNVLAVTVQPR